MLDLMTRAVEQLRSRDIAYADMRNEVRFTTQLAVVNGGLRTFTRNNYSGTVARVLVGECWGQASTTKPLTAKALADITDSATRAAMAGAKFSRRLIDLSHVKPSIGTFHQDVREDPRNVSDEEKLDLVMRMDRAQKIDERVVNTNSIYLDNQRSYKLVNTAGSALEWDEIRTYFVAQPVAREGSRVEFDYGIKSGTTGFELVRQTDVESVASDAAKSAIMLLSAEKPPSGELTVVMDGTVSGTIAHEVCGHASEADEVVKKRSFLTGMVGAKMASEAVTLVDDGTRPGLIGSIPFDSEGTPSSKTLIIESGVYRGYLHTLETSSLMGVKPTGNGRAQDFNRRIFARMTNTFFDTGDWKDKEMIEDTKDGLYVCTATSGMEDVVGGGVQVSSQKAYLLRNGEVKDFVRGVALTGKVLDILKTVDAVSDTLRFEGGTCGKGEEDFVSVSTGGPHMRARVIVGGG